jgi:hypothetical protein
MFIAWVVNPIQTILYINNSFLMFLSNLSIQPKSSGNLVAQPTTLPHVQILMANPIQTMFIAWVVNLIQTILYTNNSFLKY